MIIIICVLNYFVYFSLDIRDRPIEQGKHWSDDRTLGSRAYFVIDPPQSFLTIDSVEETDMGIYKCRVDFKYSPTKNYQVNLTVIGKLSLKHLMNEIHIFLPYDEKTSLF